MFLAPEFKTPNDLIDYNNFIPDEELKREMQEKIDDDLRDIEIEELIHHEEEKRSTKKRK